MKTVNLIITFFLILVSGAVAEETTTLTWHGHAAFEIRTPKGKVLMIDPWLKNPLNPDAKDGADPLAKIEKVDYILITHGHFDHVGEAVELGKKTGAKLVSNFELGTNLVRVAGFPEGQIGFDTLMNVGGEIPIADGEVTVAMTPAVHSSSLDPSPPEGKKEALIFAGNPGGFVLKIKDGPTIYHTGDTAYFKDMELLARYSPDLALINSGGHFGMEPDMAAECAKAVHAKLVVPMHYKTFPILSSDLNPMFKKLDVLKIKHVELAPGGTLTFVGNKLSQK